MRYSTAVCLCRRLCNGASRALQGLASFVGRYNTTSITPGGCWSPIHCYFFLRRCPYDTTTVVVSTSEPSSKASVHARSRPYAAILVAPQQRVYQLLCLHFNFSCRREQICAECVHTCYVLIRFPCTVVEVLNFSQKPHGTE